MAFFSTCSQVQINLPRSTINLIRVVLQHTSLNTDHSLLRDESPSVWLHTGRRRGSEKISPKTRREKRRVFLCASAHEERERAPCDPRYTHRCQPLFYDVVLQLGCGTWHMQGEHAITCEQTWWWWSMGCKANGQDRSSPALQFDAR